MDYPGNIYRCLPTQKTQNSCFLPKREGMKLRLMSSMMAEPRTGRDATTVVGMNRQEGLPIETKFEQGNVR